MKLMIKSKTYKAANVTFDPATMEAYSYGWWRFVERIGGKVVFNSYNYSPTTIKHQYKVRRLMESLGIKIDIEIESPSGLQYSSTCQTLFGERPTNGLNSAIRLYQERIETLRAEMAAPRSQKKKNAERLEAIKRNEQKIDAVLVLIKAQRKLKAVA